MYKISSLYLFFIVVVVAISLLFSITITLIVISLRCYGALLFFLDLSFLISSEILTSTS